MSIDRAEFNERIRPSIEETIRECLRMLGENELDWGDLAEIVVVGGSGQIPLVAELLVERSGRPVRVAAEPDLAVVRGAALLASGRSTYVALDRHVPPLPVMPTVSQPIAPSSWPELVDPEVEDQPAEIASAPPSVRSPVEPLDLAAVDVSFTFLPRRRLGAVTAGVAVAAIAVPAAIASGVPLLAGLLILASGVGLATGLRRQQSRITIGPGGLRHDGWARPWAEVRTVYLHGGPGGRQITIELAAGRPYPVSLAGLEGRVEDVVAALERFAGGRLRRRTPG